MVSTSISSSGNLASTKDSSFAFALKTDNNGLNFKKIMKQSISSNSDAKTTKISSEQTTASDSSISTSVSNDKNDNDIKNNQNDENNKDVKNSKDVSKELNKTDNNKSENVGDDKIDGMIKEIKDEIKKTFGISDEQLETALANLGITMQDLLKPINLTNLVCEITGTQDALSLLTDSGLSQQLKSVMDFVNTQVNSLAKDMNISLDELKAFIDNSEKTNQEQAVGSEGNKIQVDENVSVIKVQSEDALKNINNQETVKPNSNEQPKNDLQSVIETKVTVATEQQSDGSRSKDNNESSGKNQQFNTITNNLTQSIQGAFDNIVVENASKINTADVINQIVEAAKVTVTQELSSMELQLNPENLGKINLTVVAKNGLITAQITAENETVKKAIENQLSVLKENLNNQGIKVEAVEVTIASHSFENNRNTGKDDANQESSGKQSNKPFSLDSIEDLSEEELSDEERRIMHMLKGNDSSVEYSA